MINKEIFLFTGILKIFITFLYSFLYGQRNFAVVYKAKFFNLLLLCFGLKSENLSAKSNNRLCLKVKNILLFSKKR